MKGKNPVNVFISTSWSWNTSTSHQPRSGSDMHSHEQISRFLFTSRISTVIPTTCNATRKASSPSWGDNQSFVLPAEVKCPTFLLNLVSITVGSWQCSYRSIDVGAEWAWDEPRHCHSCPPLSGNLVPFFGWNWKLFYLVMWCFVKNSKYLDKLITKIFSGLPLYAVSTFTGHDVDDVSCKALPLHVHSVWAIPRKSCIEWIKNRWIIVVDLHKPIILYVQDFEKNKNCR